jgi:hypothetical protein
MLGSAQRGHLVSELTSVVMHFRVQEIPSYVLSLLFFIFSLPKPLSGEMGNRKIPKLKNLSSIGKATFTL